MERSKAFTTLNFHKVCYFDCHHEFLPLNHANRRNKNSFKKGRVETSPLLHVCLVLTFGIELHIYRFALSRKKKKIFLVMVLNIIGRNKIYFGCYRIEKHNFYAITLMSCTQRNVFMNVIGKHNFYKARLCGPVQYHWMYPFERYKMSNHLYTIVLYI